MIHNGVLLRKEVKYLLNYQEYLTLLNLIKGIAKHDSNVREDGKYSVQSIYFDDIHNSAYNNKKMGLPKTHKFRIRTYNYELSTIKLEKKIKLGEYSGKDSVLISNHDYYDIVNGNPGIISRSANNLLRDFYAESVTKLLKPKILVAYEREAYIYKMGSEFIRITLDNDLKWSLNTLDFSHQNALYVNAYDENKFILEIKYFNHLPEIVSDFLNLLNRFNNGSSKYQLCRKQKEMMNWRGSYG